MEAKELGLVRYYTGGSCKHGHIAERLVSNWTCVICNSLHVAKHERDTRGTEAHRERSRRRNASKAHKAAMARHRATDKYKQSCKRMRSSPAFKAKYAEYKKTAKYKENRARAASSEALWRASDRGKAIAKATRNRRYLEDTQYRLQIILRARLRAAIRHDCRRGSAVQDLGCSIAEFKSYIELRFLPGMSWENWSRTGWHLDHIKPLARFDLSVREQLLRACHYSNYQPLWAEDNQRKWAKYTLDEDSHETN